MSRPTIDILMYHSISNGAGPTSISAADFESQMKSLAVSGVQVISMDKYLSFRNGAKLSGSRFAIITFDDGFEDFAETAWPVLQKYDFPSIVYIPTGHVGKSENWRGSDIPPRPLMGWSTIRSLAKAGVDFGSHTVSHPDLTLLSGHEIDAELSSAKRQLEDKLGKLVEHFAPPYGLTDEEILKKIAQNYQTSVGTALASANESSDIFDLPRLEMHYFSDAQRWRQHLAGKGSMYMRKRQVLRRVRSYAVKPWRRI